jgi:hypothetical protein
VHQQRPGIAGRDIARVGSGGDVRAADTEIVCRRGR